MYIVRNTHYCRKEDSMADKEMNKIRKMRKDAGMTQKMFSEFFGIPVRTLQDWEAGVRKPPDYIVRLLPYKLMLEWDYENRRPKELKRSEKN
jgi:DNA-binding transcriptional regulator YiaG